jgi:hypothetical protein
MNIGEAKRLTGGGLGKVSKMPGQSYSLSANKCLTGGKLAKIKGSVCSVCYALDRGNYQYPSVKISHANHMAALQAPQWSSAMAVLILRGGQNVFRWFDAGDLQGVWHIEKIVAVCKLTPRVRHWLPTKELAFVLAYTKAGGLVPGNLVIRASGTMIDGPATKAWPTTSVVWKHTAPAEGAHACPAQQQGNECKGCRACWDPKVKQVAYHAH